MVKLMIKIQFVVVLVEEMGFDKKFVGVVLDVVCVLIICEVFGGGVVILLGVGKIYCCECLECMVCNLVIGEQIKKEVDKVVKMIIVKVLKDSVNG